ncbi:SymE family type I addiction module toxin [Niastella populi]|uniref:Toxin SymE-like domain-containing protein n=1 Tax=Niastella populi TaxID=550983 RepID=A0A1V9ESF9_9BACT|nr:SymE family type I addiction module toxin [Niastella populi]OQP49079.1 hypothetical protein A4R26_31190 [Niastella populi]
MEIQTEYHTTQKTLFRRVNQIRNANGLCVFEEEGPGYKLQYCDDVDLKHVYIVLKGKEGQPFTLHDEFYECYIRLREGDVLVYECDENNKVWFSIPSKAGHENEDTEETVGYSDYGPITEMVKSGLIINAKNRDLSLHAFLREVSQEREIVKTKETEVLPASSPHIEVVEQEPVIFDLLTELLQRDDLKTALDQAQCISEYCNKETGVCIRTHHVMYRFYCTGYSFFKGFQYQQTAQMRFGGRWMERAGFDTGQEIKIITINGMILIVPIHPPESLRGEPE